MFTATAYAQTNDPAATEADGELEETIQEAIEVPASQPSESAFPPFETSTFPSQLLWLAITFGLFYIFLQKVVVPRIGGILEVRRDRIAQDLDQAARMREESDAAVAAYEQDLAEARSKANAIASSARDKAKADAEAEQRKAEAALEVRLTEAERRIASIKDAAMSDVGVIAEETAATIVEEMVGAKVDKRTAASAVAAAQ
ncbi:MAG: F0F1 ATP synthase subunit B [Rhizobiaceae bacterium]